MSSIYDNWIAWTIGALGFTSYFLLFRCWLEQRSRKTGAQPAHAWLHCLPAMIGALPLLGLLGTISGLLDTFRMMALPGNAGGDLLSKGISDALLTTQGGLAFAIPAWLLLNYLHALEAVPVEERN